MQLSLRSLQNGHQHVEAQYEPSLFQGIEGDLLRVISPAKLSLDIDQQETARYHVAGHLAGEIELVCSRCLEPFGFPVSADFDLRYVPRTENAGEGEREVEEDDLATSFYADDQIDLSQLMMEQFHLAVPMKPLCREACKGLCPQCGVNLNTSVCDCNPMWTDPRLDALKQFKTQA